MKFRQCNQSSVMLSVGTTIITEPAVINIQNLKKTSMTVLSVRASFVRLEHLMQNAEWTRNISTLKSRNNVFE